MPDLSRTFAMLNDDIYGQTQLVLMQRSIRLMKVPMEHVFQKKRPCGCDGSFPSGHMMNIGWPVAFVYHRYGWQYGLPLYAAATGYAKDRHMAKAHYWSDLIGTTLIMHGMAYLTVYSYQPGAVRRPPVLDRFHFIATHNKFLATYDLH
jgi:membrane-associated phospholipid phosphatase